MPINPCLLANSRALSRRRCLSREQPKACLSQVHLSKSSLIILKTAVSQLVYGFQDISTRAVLYCLECC